MKKAVFTLAVVMCSMLSSAEPTFHLLFLSDIECFFTIDSDSVLTSYMNVFVVPEEELIVIQLKNLNTQDLDITLLDTDDNLINQTKLYQASTIAFFDTKTLYGGNYVIKISDGRSSIFKNITLNKK